MRLILSARRPLLIAAAAATLAACGGGDSAPAIPPTPAPTVIAPAITTQPAAVSVTEGQPAMFSVVASGSAPLTYQWRRNGSDIAGATTSAYSLTTTLADNGAAFSVVVRNSAGSATSSTATLSVAPQSVVPTVSAQPVAVSTTAGGSARFSVTVAGTPAPTLQWFVVGGADLADGAGSGALAGAMLAGSTSATLSLTNVPAGANGLQLAVRATNRAGSVTSTAATLSVSAAGQLIVAAAGGTVSSADGRVRLVIPAAALNADARVRIDPTPEFTVPGGLAAQLAAIAGSGYTIVTEGGSFLPDRDLALRVNLSGLPGVVPVRPLSNPPTATPPADLLAVECPDGGEPLAVAFNPGRANDNDLGTVVRGCAAGSGGGSRTRIAPTRLPPVPANVVWTLYRQPNDAVATLDFDHWQEANGRSRTLMISEWSGTVANLQLRVADERGQLLLDLPLPAGTSLARFASTGVFYTARKIVTRQLSGPCAGTEIGSSTEVTVWRMTLRLPGWRAQQGASILIPGTPGTASLVNSVCTVTGAVSNAPAAVAADPVSGALVLLGQGDSDNPGFPELAPGVGAAPGFIVRIAPDASVSQVQRVHGTVGPLAVDGGGNVLVAGSATFVPRLPSAYGSNLGTCAFSAASCVVLARFSPAGGLLWARYVDQHFIGSTRAELAADRAGNAIYVSASGSGNAAIVSTIDATTGQSAPPVTTGSVGSSFGYTRPRVDSQNRVAVGVRSASGVFVVTLGTGQSTPVPSANPLVRFDFSLDASDRVVSAHGSSIVASQLCTPFPTTPGFCRGWLMQKFNR
ncbi:MAG: immunoglobulin domain-containing protein [Burkholderiaceae bacterium]|jgi:hypothetical protein|nr:immunoglobulin domain-containing protein [Burkholderiaceae bacterium]